MSDGKKLAGVQFNPEKNLAFPYVEQELDYHGLPGAIRTTGAEAISGVDQTPTDKDAAKVRTFDVEAIQTAFEGITFKYPFRLKSVNLPLEMTAMAVVINSATGTGTGNHPTGQQGFILNSGSASLSPRSVAESSATISFELQPTWRPTLRSNGPAMACGFYLTGNVTESDILTAVSGPDLMNATVSAWPDFKEKIHSFVLSGQQASVRASADTNASVGVDTAGVVRSAAYAYGDDSSKQTGTTQRVVDFPACINATIILSPTTSTITATAQVSANTVSITNTIAGEIIPPIENEPAEVELDATASVTPTTVVATPVTTIPSSGLRLYDYTINDVGFGVYQIVAIVIEMSHYV